MEFSRRDFIKSVSAAALSCSFPLTLAGRARADDLAHVNAHLRVKDFGANICTWIFDKSRLYRREQINQVKRWRFTKLRHNTLTAYLEGYDINHAVTVVEECQEAGIEYTFVAADAEPGVEDLVTSEQKAALMQRYDGNINNVRRAITSIGIGADISHIRDFLLDRIMWMRGQFPQGVRMQPYNGPELDGYRHWNMYDLEFRGFARGVGFQVPEESGPGFAQPDTIIRQNYDDFRLAAKAIWGEPWLNTSNHVYEFDGRVRYTGAMTPHVTEFGVDLYSVPNRADAFRTLPLRIIQATADAGIEASSPGGVWNVKEIFLHAPLDGRWKRVLWRGGDTRPLWDPVLYQAFLDSQGRQWLNYDAVMMEPGIPEAIGDVMRVLGAGRRWPKLSERPVERGKQLAPPLRSPWRRGPVRPWGSGPNLNRDIGRRAA
ncbi:MAG: hypothetical protein IH851_00655 [Armatimonadetes bacterium]|nr:hypothetical protein [Armatimonadota bacterium]